MTAAVPFSGFKGGQVARTMIETAGGGFFDFTNPRPEDVHLSDVASSLSKVCRFAGHVSRFYSVAEHAVLVRDLVIAAGHHELALPALHHDSEETYLGDVTTPLKALLGDAFQKVREPLDAVVGEALGIDPELFHHPVVVDADLQALRAEAWVLKAGRGSGWGLDHISTRLPAGLSIVGMSPPSAERAFLAAHALETSR